MAFAIKTFAMMRTILILGGLFGLTFSAPAQVVQANFGKHISIGIGLGGHHEPAYPPIHYPPPIRPAPAGEWREITERVWIAGTCREICHPPVWGWSFDHCGRRVWTIIRAGWTERIEEPGHWECRTRQVWVAYPTCGSGESWHGGGRGWHR